MHLYPIICISQFTTIGKPIGKSYLLDTSKTLTAFNVIQDTNILIEKRDTNQSIFLSLKSDYKLGSKYYLPLLHISYNSDFGYRSHPVSGQRKLHQGVDLKAYYEPVYAIANGFITKAGERKKEGNYIVISHGEIESIYCHLAEIFCHTGQYIKGGECIGISGNTGQSTGPHLHFGIRYKGLIFNPKLYLNSAEILNPKGIL